MLLDALESASWAFRNSLRDKYVCIAHMLLVFAHLSVKQIRKYLSCDYFVLMSGIILIDRYFGLHAELQFGLFGIKIESSTFFILIAIS